MNRADKAGEPSMEEILATVRQIIAEEPGTSSAVFPALEPNPFVPKSQSADVSASKTPDSTATDRLSGVLKNGSLPATRPLGSKRPTSFDQDLADILDEADGEQTAAPKPAMRTPEFAVPAKPAEPSPKPASASAPPATAANAIADAALPPPFAPSAPQPSVPPLFGGSSAAAPTPPTRTFGFPPLRKSSFFPPQAPVTPTLPPISEPAAPRADAGAKPAEERAPGDSGTLDEALKRLSNLGAIVPGEPVAPKPAMPSFGAPSAAAEAASGTGASPNGARRAPEPSLGAARGGDEKSLPGLDNALADSQPELPRVEPAAVLAAGDAVTADDVTLPPASAGSDASYKDVPFVAAPRVQAAIAETSAVAAQALDALAQGLAASAAAGPGAAIPLTPVIDPAPVPLARPSAETAPMPNLGGLALAPPGTTAPAARTLEEVIADMLRPMLQQWVADNMPRIIERALRVEVGKMTPPGQKPPGS